MFTLPKFSYSLSAFEPIISEKIMNLHYNKHHAAYVAKLNDAVQGTAFESIQIEDLMKTINTVPENIRQAVINNGGGHANHSFFWTILRSPKENNQPSKTLIDAMTASFTDFDMFREQFTQAALTRFGSGWAWLVKKPDNSLMVYSTANQDSPLMEGYTPLLALDVWEHAYYLDYLNDRAKYVSEWWKIVNWEEVEKQL
jgi:Fe-Mn family superoxide dismutase